MIKRQYRTGGTIKEAKPSNYDGELVETPDLIMADLHMRLSPEISRRIWEMNWNGVPRSEIAKQLGIPKIRVTHELVMRSIKAKDLNKYAPKSRERSSTL
ncbi:hypothetical protein [Paenibacillus sp. 8b26]|uniref:hypothetical protein n=1 Tax=Paenibacillus sp. 8b26 TaxID=3424133 RepID=UPI003D647371